MKADGIDPATADFLDNRASGLVVDGVVLYLLQRLVQLGLLSSEEAKSGIRASTTDACLLVIDEIRDEVEPDRLALIERFYNQRVEHHLRSVDAVIGTSAPV